MLRRETYGDTTLDFLYDANGTPFSLLVNGTNWYYYITNLQGDVIRLVDYLGNTAAYYEYDPYGNATNASGSHATINPLRYRGYYFDAETGMYYLQSRYYDPQVGRFINADAFASTGQGFIGFNTYAYCNNDPINRVDTTGSLPKWLTSLWNTVVDFFSPTTGSHNQTYKSGNESANISITAGHSSVSVGGQGQETAKNRKKNPSHDREGYIGFSGSASIINANGEISTWQNPNMGVSASATGDVLGISGYAGIQYKNGFGIGAGAMATAASGTVTAGFDIYGWKIVIGATGYAGSIGVDAAMGFVDGKGSCKFSAAAGIGGGFIFEFQIPDRYY